MKVKGIISTRVKSKDNVTERGVVSASENVTEREQPPEKIE
jgi:hypothetical protein